MRSLNDIYNLSAVLTFGLLSDGSFREQFFPIDRRKVRNLATRQLESPWLVVKRIQYGSPGLVDLAGLGTLAGHVKEFLLGLLDRYLNRKIRSVELQERLLLAEKMKFETDLEREQKLAVAHHDEQLHALDIRSREIDLRNLEEKNRQLMIKNFESESEFAAKIVRLCRDNKLTIEQISQLLTWIRSRERPLIELIELNQILEVQDRDEDSPQINSS